MKAADLLRILRRRATLPGLDRQERDAKGGNVLVRHAGRTATVPMHRGDIPVSTYRAIPRQPGLSDLDLEH
jgi:hypothetical protein